MIEYLNRHIIIMRTEKINKSLSTFINNIANKGQG